MSDVRKIVALLLRLLLSFIFFYTAIAKLRPIEPFEYTLVETGWIGWEAASVLARGIVGLEWAFGFLLLTGTSWQKVKLALLSFLGILSLYLIVLLIQKGNIADCGCLGAAHSISPLLSLAKNAGMIVAVLSIDRLKRGPALPIAPKLISSSLLLAGVALPFFIEPLGASGSDPEDGSSVEKLSLEELEEMGEKHESSLELSEGKKILAFMSTTCHWCRTATRKLKIVDERTEKELPYHFFLYGDDASEKQFWKLTRAGPYPSTRISLEKLLEFAGGTVPTLILVEDGEAKLRLDFNDIREERIRRFMDEAEKE